MSSSLLLRLFVVVVVFAALATEVHLISRLDLEETRGPIELERVSSSSSLGRSSFPQLYNLYMDPVRKGLSSSSSSFDVVHPQKKRSRLFVGKRINDNDDFFSDDEDLILVSDDNNDDESFDVKRNHLFVGKRASPRFVGKRSATNQPSRMTRRKRFASNEYGGRGDGKGMMEDSDEGSRMWKLWMTAGTGEEEEEGNAAADKRARMFVGKRRQMEADDRKRSRLFVGRRAESEDVEKDSGIAHPADVDHSEEEGAAKRSRLFVGKRHPEDHTSVEGGFDAKEADTMHGGSPPMAAGGGGPTDDKRIHLFPGKRPAPGFVGKRDD